jgi:sec-independent protein translocase protein TatA
MELLLVLVIVLIVFGAGKLPQLGEGLGKAIKGFKKSVHEPEPQLEAQASPIQAIQAPSATAQAPAAAASTPAPGDTGKAQG